MFLRRRRGLWWRGTHLVVGELWIWFLIWLASRTRRRFRSRRVTTNSNRQPVHLRCQEHPVQRVPKQAALRLVGELSSSSHPLKSSFLPAILILISSEEIRHQWD